MKIELVLSRTALPTAIAAFATAALGALAFDAFTAFVATLMLLTVIRDYARPPRALTAGTPARRAERMPLAA
jgi:hypothetical protein